MTLSPFRALHGSGIGTKRQVIVFGGPAPPPRLAGPYVPDMIPAMWRKCSRDLTSVSAVLAVLLLLAAHGGIIPRFATHDPDAVERRDMDLEPSGQEDTSAPLDLLTSLPGEMLIRVHAQGPSGPSALRSGGEPRATACGRLDPTPRSELASAVLGGAYHLISLRRDAYLARPSVDPLARARAPRDPALTSSISILGPPSA